jgi:hypothetical protein
MILFKKSLISSNLSKGCGEKEIDLVNWVKETRPVS